MKNIIKTEPATIVGLLGALLTLLIAFGVSVTEDQVQAILAFATVLVPLVAGYLTRSLVTPAEGAVSNEDYLADLETVRSQAKAEKDAAVLSLVNLFSQEDKA